MILWPFWLVLAAYGGQRLFELWLNDRNAAQLRARGGQLVTDDVYRLIVVLHVAFFVAVAAEWLLAPWSGLGWWSLLGLPLFLAGQGLRYWSMHVLGDRWTTQIYVVPGEAPVRRGPYRYLDHPIYLGVGLELLGFPLIWGLPGVALLASLVHVPLIRERIRREEAAWASAGAASRQR